jgi:hypothetical protein
MPGQLGVQCVLVAYQQDANAVLLRRLHRPFDFGRGRVLASHRVNGYGDQLGHVVTLLPPTSDPAATGRRSGIYSVSTSMIWRPR